MLSRGKTKYDTNKGLSEFVQPSTSDSSLNPWAHFLPVISLFWQMHPYQERIAHSLLTHMYKTNDSFRYPVKTRKLLSGATRANFSPYLWIAPCSQNDLFGIVGGSRPDTCRLFQHVGRYSTYSCFFCVLASHTATHSSDSHKTMTISLLCFIKRIVVSSTYLHTYAKYFRI